MSRDLDLTAPREKRLKPGTVIADRYRIVEVAGEGGVGVVYRAVQIHMNKTVALKMLRNDDTTDAATFKRFQQEAKAASSLNHPNIIQIHDFGVLDGDQAYMVMDFLEGRSLQLVIRERMSLERFGHIFLQACDALEHAHQQGVIHRDLKPSNLLLINKDDDKDFLVIVDFGLVKLLTQEEDQKLTTTGEVVGSPLYMSPEQCRALDVDGRSDIYSIGCVMYQALTGFPPFLGGNPMDTMYQHMTKEPAALNDANKNTNVPEAVEHLVLKCMAKSPGLRYQTMGQLKTALEQATKGKRQPASAAAAAEAPSGMVTQVKDFSHLIKQRPTTPAPAPKKRQSSVWVWLAPIIIVVLIAVAAVGWLTTQSNLMEKIEHGGSAGRSTRHPGAATQEPSEGTDSQRQ